MTVSQAILRADALAPNTLSQPDKCRHLAQVDQRVVCELYEYNRQAVLALPKVDEPAAELLIPAPWDEAYVYYLAAMIEYARGEIARYNEHIALFTSLWEGYAAHLCRTRPTRGGFRY